MLFFWLIIHLKKYESHTFWNSIRCILWEVCQLGTFFCQITTFIKVCVAFVFCFRPLKDITKIYWLKALNWSPKTTAEQIFINGVIWRKSIFPYIYIFFQAHCPNIDSQKHLLNAASPGKNDRSASIQLWWRYDIQSFGYISKYGKRHHHGHDGGSTIPRCGGGFLWSLLANALA